MEKVSQNLLFLHFLIKETSQYFKWKKAKTPVLMKKNLIYHRKESCIYYEIF